MKYVDKKLKRKIIHEKKKDKKRSKVLVPFGFLVTENTSSTYHNNTSLYLRRRSMSYDEHEVS